MIALHAPQKNSEWRNNPSSLEAEMLQDDDFILPAELAIHLSDCQVACISFHGKTRYFAKKGLTEWLGLQHEKMLQYILPAGLEKVLIISDVKHNKELLNSYAIELPGQTRFLASFPIILGNGIQPGCFTLLGVEPKAGLTEAQRIAIEIIVQQIARLADSKFQNKQLLEIKNDLLLAASKRNDLKTEEFRQELKYIAYKMHEDFAQTLAATKLYLEFAEDDQHSHKHFLKISKDTIEQVIQKMRNLCKAISPAASVESGML